MDQQHLSNSPGQRKLYSLQVRPADIIDLTEIVNDRDFVEPTRRGSDSTAALSLCFWLFLLALPVACLFFLGLFVGSGN